MPSDFDAGLLSPVSAGVGDSVGDAAVLAALVTAEVALARAWDRARGTDELAAHASSVFGWAGPGELCADPGIDAEQIAQQAVAGGNPVIPLVHAMNARLRTGARVHRGATSQDILDSALMLLSRRVLEAVAADLRALEERLGDLAATHRDRVAAARTLTQHAVPTTVGLRIVTRLRAVRRARRRLAEVRDQLPAQLGGAGGTRAAFLASAVEEHGSAGAAIAARLPAAFAEELGLADAGAPWHVERWPVTELGDALVQTVDALGAWASDVATGARTEIGEWVDAAAGGSSAMPQKRNPTGAVLVRSAALRAPQLAATLHTAAAFAGDERPDGAWHAEWPTLRELLRLTAGVAATSRRYTATLELDEEAVARNVSLTGGLLVAERVGIVLQPRIGGDAVEAAVGGALEGRDLATSLDAELQRASDREGRSQFRSGGVAALLDPAGYTGFAAALVDDALADES